MLKKKNNKTHGDFGVQNQQESSASFQEEASSACVLAVLVFPTFWKNLSYLLNYFQYFFNHVTSGYF